VRNHGWGRGTTPYLFNLQGGETSNRGTLELSKHLNGFDRGNCNNGGLIVPKSKIEDGQDRRKPGVPRMNFIFF
jgi:hypothetical protein